MRSCIKPKIDLKPHNERHTYLGSLEVHGPLGRGFMWDVDVPSHAVSREWGPSRVEPYPAGSAVGWGERLCSLHGYIARAVGASAD